MRYRLRETVAAKINANTAFINGLPDVGHAELRTALNELSEELLNDRQSWIESDLKVKQTASATQESGVNFVFSLKKSLQLESGRQWSNFKSSQDALRSREGLSTLQPKASSLTRVKL